MWDANGVKIQEATYKDGQMLSDKRWNAKGELIAALGTAATGETPKPPPNVTAPENAKPNPNAIGRRNIWTTAQITGIYKGKPTATLLAAFGPPDQRLGDTWVYRMMRFRAGNRLVAATVSFVIADNKVDLVQVN